MIIISRGKGIEKYKKQFENISVLLYLGFEYLLYMVIQFLTNYSDQYCNPEKSKSHKEI